MRRFYHHHPHNTMDAIRNLTNTINTFVNLFQSINCLFWQLRWLEGNINSENGPTLLLVLAIVSFAGFYTYCSSSGLEGGICSDVNTTIGVVVVLILVGIWLMRKRLFINRAIPTAEAVSFESEREKMLSSASAPLRDIEMVRPLHIV
ncbi:hypothetical protein EON65_42690 [archaeon]|nr:MAG: hypothetical protein EON65_42690 [archaeon]